MNIHTIISYILSKLFKSNDFQESQENNDLETDSVINATNKLIEETKLEYSKFMNIDILPKCIVTYENVNSSVYIEYASVNIKSNGNNIFINISNAFNSLPDIEKKAILFHEFTHAYDLIYSLEANIDLQQKKDFMQTYSEYHAKIIEFMYRSDVKSISDSSSIPTDKKIFYQDNYYILDAVLSFIVKKVQKSLFPNKSDLYNEDVISLKCHIIQKEIYYCLGALSFFSKYCTPYLSFSINEFIGSAFGKFSNNILNVYTELENYIPKTDSSKIITASNELTCHLMRYLLDIYNNTN